jgi:hypothetical protein
MKHIDGLQLIFRTVEFLIFCYCGFEVDRYIYIYTDLSIYLFIQCIYSFYPFVYIYKVSQLNLSKYLCGTQR